MRATRKRVGVLALSCCLSAVTALALDDQQGTVDVAGAPRHYKIHTPPGLDANVRAPLVLVLHGGGGSAENIANNSGMGPKADREKFVVAYPEGVGRNPGAYTWNASHCCAFAMTTHAPDVDFIAKMLDEIEKTRPIDQKRVYICGMSNGGMMSHRIAAVLADRIAAAGIVSGAIFDDQPKPSHPVPIIMFHGTADPVVPFKGGKSPNETVAASMDAPFLSVQAAFDFWSKHDGCEGAVAESASGTATKRSHESCKDGTAVVLYEIRDGVHAWPGGQRGAVAAGTISATDLMWTFFASHPKP